MALSKNAAELQDAYQSRDAKAFAQLLKEDVFWGDPDDPQYPEACHNAKEVLAWYEGLIKQGVTARVTEVIEDANMVALGLSIEWPTGVREDPPGTRYQIFRFQDEGIDLIFGVDDRTTAIQLMREWSQRQL